MKGSGYAADRRMQRRHRDAHDVDAEIRAVEPVLNRVFQHPARLRAAPTEQVINVVCGEVLRSLPLGDEPEDLLVIDRSKQEPAEVADRELYDHVSRYQ